LGFDSVYLKPGFFSRTEVYKFNSSAIQKILRSLSHYEEETRERFFYADIQAARLSPMFFDWYIWQQLIIKYYGGKTEVLLVGNRPIMQFAAQVINQMLDFHRQRQSGE
jgi:hypothetical protein